MGIKNTFYVLTCISFSIILGAGIYEHVAVWPNAYSEPPQSLTMFQGKYALESAPFWMSIHPVTLVLFITALVLNWKSERRKNILIPLVIYMTILVITSIYFVPELISINNTSYAEKIDADLRKRGNTWIALSLIRACILVAADFILLLGLTRPACRISKT